MTRWKVKRAADTKDLGEGFFRPEFDDSAWETADVDRAFKEGRPPYTERFIFYRKWVDVPAAWKGREISVVFGAVDDDAVVYVNGRKMGEHKGWNEEFTIAVTEVARCGGRNLFAVLCENTGGPGGIWRRVSLVLTEEIARRKAAEEAQLRLELKRIAHKIVYETYRQDNWELYVINADGSDPVNLTRTPGADEMYPHASPDGKRLCFVADERVGDKKVRNVYYSNIDGTGRIKVADNARQPCWSPDGKAIAYLKGEFERYTIKDYATKGVFFYDLETRRHTEHPNKELHHLYNICWSPDGNWFLATVHGGMGYRHAILVFEAGGTGVFDLSKWGVGGCRPEFGPDGRRMTWGRSDESLRAGSIDLTGPEPRVSDVRDVASCPKGFEVYHADWSPDGRYIAFSHGPKADEKVGGKAPGWNICVGDGAGKWVAVTTDGNQNKEPDWVPTRSLGRANMAKIKKLMSSAKRAEVSGDPAAATAIYEQILTQFSSTDEADAAAEAIGRLKESVSRVENARRRREEAATRQLETAEQLVERGEYARGVAALKKLAASRGGTEAGRKADELASELEKRDEVRRAMDEMRARSRLSLAKNYVRAGLKEKAIEYCREVLAKYPGTESAEEAASIMKGFGR